LIPSPVTILLETRTNTMPQLTSMTLSQLMDAFASNEPLPGGGSASALAAATGASLLIMAATLPKTRSGAVEETADLAATAVRLRPIRDELIALIDRDTDAYANLLAAFRFPKTTEDDQARRRDAIITTTHLATEAPLETMRASRQALRSAVIIAQNGARAASSDIATAVELLLAAVRGAGGSVDSNLAALKDQEYVERIDAERRQLEDESISDAELARAAL
jgi:methenyltetrahydrofolate cyclohydrolase